MSSHSSSGAVGQWKAAVRFGEEDVVWPKPRIGIAERKPNGPSMRCALDLPHDRNNRCLVSLVGGMIDSARAAVGGQVDALRHEVDDRVAAASSTLISMLIAFGILIVAALLLALALAGSLVALGVPLWIALWSVTVAVTAIGVGAVIRASTKTPKPAPTD
jgi:hypothetical protein